ncbi:MAG: hypothetical protein Q8O95_02320 [bacterium]|nr:hypothetical protein [bacterium]
MKKSWFIIALILILGALVLVLQLQSGGLKSQLLDSSSPGQSPRVDQASDCDKFPEPLANRCYETACQCDNITKPSLQKSCERECALRNR